MAEKMYCVQAVVAAAASTHECHIGICAISVEADGYAAVFSRLVNGRDNVLCHS